MPSALPPPNLFMRVSSSAEQDPVKLVLLAMWSSSFLTTNLDSSFCARSWWSSRLQVSLLHSSSGSCSAKQIANKHKRQRASETNRISGVKNVSLFNVPLKMQPHFDHEPIQSQSMNFQVQIDHLRQGNLEVDERREWQVRCTT